ncbi:hypothetical protein DRO35_01020 [Candidatus Bathyarchaeota archaeon]|nr:MAG: hypothetical protein DRO35_01020 [Candidatus Bathyarchaeota archaeon]
MKEKPGVTASLYRLGKNLNREEVSDGFFMTPDDIEKSLKTEDKNFPHDFKVAFEEFSKTP